MEVMDSLNVNILMFLQRDEGMLNVWERCQITRRWMQGMKQLSTSLTLRLLLALICLSPLHAQTASQTPANSNPATASPAPAGQVPDEMTRKITELVLAGKYAEAQKLTEGLLIAYPNDQRLLKAKALIDSRLAPGGSTSAAPSNVQPTQPAANANAEQLTGMDKVDFNALIELARQAQLNTDLEQQKASLQQFMDQSSVFLRKHPDQMLLWQLRAASAISLNEPLEGFEAGQKLLAAGAADSSDPALQQLLGRIKNKGWLDKEGAEKLYEQQRYILVTTGSNGNGISQPLDLKNKLDHSVTEQLQSRFQHINIRTSTPDGGPDPIVRVSINISGFKDNCVYGGFISLHFTCDENSTFSISLYSPAGLHVDRNFDSAFVKSNIKHSDMSDYLLNDWIVQEVLGKLNGVLDEDAIHRSLSNSVSSP